MFMNASTHPSGRRSLLTRALLWVFIFGCVASAHAQYTATANLNTNYQTFEGWGTSLAWWANVVGGYPNTNRNDYVGRVFDPTYGLGLNVVRYNIGGGENPKYLAPNFTYLQYRAQVPGFLASSSASYDWTKDANQRWVLQQAILKGVTVSEAFSNSPPWWMTNSGSVTGAADGGNNLNPTFAPNFADYLTSVVKQYHDNWGITFRTVEAFNEPSAYWWKFGADVTNNNGTLQEGCGFDRTTQNSFVKTLGASLASKSINYTTVSASDENSIDDAVLSFNALDSTAQGYLSQVNTHTYNGSERTQLASAAAGGSKRLSVSEYGDGDATGLTMAQQILTDLKGLQPKNWVYWQAVEGVNGDGSPSGWGLLTTKGLDGSANYGYTFNEKYYVMGNFSKFIRPGYQFVGMDDPNSVAAYDGNGTIVLVTVNSTGSAQAVTYNLQNLPAAMGSGPWNVQAYQTSATENLAAQPPFSITSGTFYTQIPANSVTTFVINGVTIDSQVAANSPAIVDGGQYVIYTQWNYPGDSNVQVLQEDNRISGQATAAPGVPLVTDGNWCNGVLGCSSIDHARVWVAHAAGSNKWVFTNLHSEDNGTPMALDISGTTDLSTVVQSPRTDGPTQLWTVQPTSDNNSYRLNPALSNLSLHMDGNGWWAGAPVDLCTEADSACNDGWGQRYEWHLVPFQGSAMSTSLAVTYPSNVSVVTNVQLVANVATNGGIIPTGTVTFFDGATELGQATLSGTSNSVTYTAGKLSAGVHNLSAVYSGDSSNLSSAAAETPLNVNPLLASSTSLTSSASSVAVGQKLTFTATISVTSSSLPTGTMKFMSGSTVLASVPVMGNIVTYSTSSLAAGAYSVTASYSGDTANAASSSSAVLVTVNAAGASASSVTLSSSPAAPIIGSPVTLTAAVKSTGGTPTGNVFFLDGSSVIGSGPLSASGSVTVTTSSLAVGVHSLTAFYVGDATFANATSSVDSLQVYAVPVGDYVLSTSINQLQLNGSSAGVFISVATSGGFNQPITFSCSGLPAGYSCAFAPATLTPNSNGIQSTQLLFVGQNTAALDPAKSGPGFFSALAGIGFFGLPLCWRFRRNKKIYIFILALACSFGLAMQGCTAAPPNAYTVVVTGTSLPMTHTVNVVVLK
jgi:O-glycosyl hydrolase